MTAKRLRLFEHADFEFRKLLVFARLFRQLNRRCQPSGSATHDEHRDQGAMRTNRPHLLFALALLVFCPGCAAVRYYAQSVSGQLEVLAHRRPIAEVLDDPAVTDRVKDALRRVQQLLDAGKVWVVDADIKGCFDNIPQDQLLAAVNEHVSDGRVLELLRRFLKQGVMESGKGWSPTETGTPQGAIISPLLANIYLNPLDHQMAGQGREMVRYADDFVILCASREEAEAALDAVRQWMEAAGLTLHPAKTRIVDATQQGGFDFLGYHFERGYRWPRQKSLGKFKDAIRRKTGKLRSGSLSEITEDLNRTLRGWFEYFKHSHRTTFGPLDSWIRGRLRTLLRKRHKGKGRGRGRDHQRWPNACFAELGLISLATARVKASRPHERGH